MLERAEISKPTRGTDQDRVQLRTLAQAALKADQVTGDPAWDTMTSYIARALEVAERAHVDALKSLGNPALVNGEKIAQTRNTVFMLEERIRTLQWVVTMPSEIKRVGSVAKEKLTLMETADEEREESKS